MKKNADRFDQREKSHNKSNQDDLLRLFAFAEMTPKNRLDLQSCTNKFKT